MAVREILLIGNEALRRKSEPVDFTIDPVDGIVGDLFDTLHWFQKAKGLGRAIAAPQVGCLKRIVCMDAGGRRIVMINPAITERSAATFDVWDSCFSADAAFFGLTRRNRAITVSYADERGQTRSEEFRDDLSELFQHEIDHLDGILFTDRIVDNRIVMRSEWERMARGI